MVTTGIPFQEIAIIARDLAADLIVMGGYGRSGRGPIEEVFFGSTAEKVVRLLPCRGVVCALGRVGEIRLKQAGERSPNLPQETIFYRITPGNPL